MDIARMDDDNCFPIGVRLGYATEATQNMLGKSGMDRGRITPLRAAGIDCRDLVKIDGG